MDAVIAIVREPYFPIAMQCRPNPSVAKAGAKAPRLPPSHFTASPWQRWIWLRSGFPARVKK